MLRWFKPLSFTVLGLSTSLLYAETLSTSVETITSENSPANTVAQVNHAQKPVETWRERHQRLKDKLWIDVNINQAEDINDPFQSVNRTIHQFNTQLDRSILRPLAENYSALPETTQDAYRQFHYNLEEPWSAINQAAQGRGIRALKSLGRFTLNTLTTLGIADPARRLDLERESDGLETTLGYYGVPSGPYLMLPILGPNTFRSTLGLIVDREGGVLKHSLNKDNDDGYTFYLAEKALYGIDRRAQLIALEPTLLGGDEYAKMRDFYIQYANFQIAEKRGLTSEDLFIDDLIEENEEESSDF
jgi:phospholipid-binding lipoprotein MlaA